MIQLYRSKSIYDKVVDGMLMLTESEFNNLCNHFNNIDDEILIIIVNLIKKCNNFYKELCNTSETVNEQKDHIQHLEYSPDSGIEYQKIIKMCYMNADKIKKSHG